MQPHTVRLWNLLPIPRNKFSIGSNVRPTVGLILKPFERSHHNVVFTFKICATFVQKILKPFKWAVTKYGNYRLNSFSSFFPLQCFSLSHNSPNLCLRQKGCHKNQIIHRGLIFVKYFMIYADCVRSWINRSYVEEA